MMTRMTLGLAVLAAVIGCQVNAPAPSAMPLASDSAVPVQPVASAALPSVAPSVAYDAPRITPDEVAKRQKAGESFVIVDVRGLESFKASHIEGAVNHPWASLQQADPGFPRDKYILLYCT